MSTLEREAGILKEVVARYSLLLPKKNAHCIVHYTPPLRLSRKIGAINEGIEDHKENIIYN